MSSSQNEEVRRDDEQRASEATPLLLNAEQPAAELVADRTQVKDDDDDRPLPKVQLILLCFARLVDPFAFFSIFPFVNQMVKDLGHLSYEDVGFYSGLIESSFSLTQMLVMIFWGRVSDSYGRKPVLVICLYGVGFSMAAFGLSTKIWQMILFRCLSGIFAGSAVTIRTMFSEISTPKTQARAFSWFAFSGNLGIFLGPLIGGVLSKPATQYPSIFGGIKLFKDSPYLLPTLAIGGIGAFSATISLFFLKETHVERPKEDLEADSEEGPSSTFDLMKSPDVLTVLAIFGSIGVLGFSYTAVSTVFWFTPIHLGGFGFDEKLISLFSGLMGLSQALWLLLIFPPLQRRVGTGAILRGCGIAWPFFFLTFPLLNVLLRHATPAIWTLFWILLSISIFVGTGVAMAFTGIQLAINDVSPSPQVFATLNAIALTLSSGLRSFTPALTTSIFAIGVKEQVLGGQLVWVVLILHAILNGIAMRWLPEKTEGKVKANGDQNNMEHD